MKFAFLENKFVPATLPVKHTFLFFGYNQDISAITKWYCGCKTGARTVGCYAYVVFEL